MHSHDIHESRAMFLKARTDLNRARTAEEFARRSRDRTRRLLDLKASSEEQMEHAEAALRFAQSEVANAEVELERTRRHLVDFLQIPAEEPKEHADGTHDHDEDLIPITAPADGIVIVRNISRGAVVSPATDLFLISDLSSVWVMAEVHADQLASLKVGMPVRVIVSAFPGREFTGRIGKIGDTLNPETRTLQVRVEVHNRSKVLKPEMYATVEIEAGALEPAVYLPSESLQEVRGSSMAFVEKTPGHFEARTVSTGRMVDGAIEITRGLREGERVVTAGSFILKSEFLKASISEEE
jgi:cobalt-zinc-cadmium efflux system membrane fusion protein